MNRILTANMLSVSQSSQPLACLARTQENRNVGIGISTLLHEGDVFSLPAFNPGSPAASAGLLVGDELVSADDQRYHPIRSLENHEGGPVLIRTLRKNRGPIIERTGLLANTDATRRSAHVTELDGVNVGYVTAWSLAGELQWASLKHAISRKLADCQSLVLDLRDGIGGASPEFADYFVGHSPELRLRTLRTADEIVVNARWRKPVVVLADHTTRSGTEVLVLAMKKAGVPVVGSRTAGAVMAANDGVVATVRVMMRAWN